MSEPIDIALVAGFSEEALALFAQRLDPHLAALRSEPTAQTDGWIDAKQAAECLGMSINALHKLTAARKIPFEQDGPGCKCWFRRTELDEWRRGGLR